MDIVVERIAQAAESIDPVFLNSPQFVDEQLAAAIGRRVLTKIETVNPLRSFKGRGTDFLLQELVAEAVVCASAGNFGQGLAYAGRRHGVAVTIYCRRDANPFKVERMRSFGAEVVLVDGDDAAVKEAARAHEGARFIDDGHDTAIAEGAGTIGVELLASHRPDTIVLPVGDGALISGVAAWVRANAPATRVVGVCPTRARSMYDSFRAGHVVPGTSDTIAEGISTTVPVPTAVRRIRELVDEVVLVEEDDLREAMRLIADSLGQLVEPAGAAGVAAIRKHGLGEQPATVITGANPRPGLLAEILR